MTWFEALPPDCPPDEAFSPENSFFRLGSIPPDASDFWSHRRLFPHKVFQVSECIARSLSVFDDLEAVRQLRRLLPAMRSKPIFQVDLTGKHGLILQTGNNLHHYSWWRSTGFDLQTIHIIEE